jgi:putative Holliday junction resolvase
MKYLCLDVGDRRVGVAFGDSDLRIATPVDVLTRVSIPHDARTIADLARNYDATQLLVGLPRNMDGTQGAQAESVIEYAEEISDAIRLPVSFWDERLTTVEATRRTQESQALTQKPRSGRRGKKTRRTLDAIAASVILQDFLDSQKNETP